MYTYSSINKKRVIEETIHEKLPEDFQSAVKIDEMIRGGVRGTKEKLYLHRSLVPLTDADFATAEDRGQLTMFNDECEGMCGV